MAALTEKKQPKRKRSRELAYYADYIRCLIALTSQPRRCLITDNVFVEHDDEKLSIFSRQVMSRCISEAADHPKKRYVNNMFEHHFHNLKSKLQPEILIDMPDWDGHDRLQILAHCMRYKNCTTAQAEDALKDWGASMIRKWHNTGQQNHVLIFQGAQGIGKDTKLVRALTGHMEDYLKHLTITKSGADKELWITLRNAGCVNISEFDRISKMESSVIKDMVHREQADVVMKYENEVTSLKIRTSFIATTNTTDVYRGDAGDRRFILLEIAGEANDLSAIKIQHNLIDEEFQSQIYAQFWELFKEDYRMSDSTRSHFYAYNQGQSTDIYFEQMMEEFDVDVNALAKEKGRYTEDGYAYILGSDEELVNICDRLIKKYGTFPGRGPQINKFRNYLKETGRYLGRKDSSETSTRTRRHYYISKLKTDGPYQDSFFTNF